MKKLIACLLAVLILASLSAVAFGDSPTPVPVPVFPDVDPSEEVVEAYDKATTEDELAEITGISDEELKAGSLYYVESEHGFPVKYVFEGEAGEGLIGVLFFGIDGTQSPTFTKSNGAEVTFQAEGWYCNVYGTVTESP